ncbi:hypothetical protein ACLOJK_003979 [Asimina triloba]
MEAACSCFLKSTSLAKKTPVSLFKAKNITFYRRKHDHLQFAPGNRSVAPRITCCHPPSQNNDDRETSINQDWRSFRARLVAREQAAGRMEESDSWLTPVKADDNGQNTDPTLVKLSDKWAHRLHEPEPGCLLVATEKLDGVHIFEHTVILLLATGPIGPMGIILNRPSLMSIKEIRSMDLDMPGTFSDRPLFFGGPVEDGLFLVGPQRGGDGSNDDDDEVGKSGVFGEVMKGLYYGTKESVGCAAEMVKRNVVGVGDFRFFHGYCGWEREQLRDEIRAGFWNVVACSPSVVGLDRIGSVGLWEEILGLMGEKKVW